MELDKALIATMKAPVAMFWVLAEMLCPLIGSAAVPRR